MSPSATDTASQPKYWRFSTRRLLTTVALLALSFTILRAITEGITALLAIPAIGGCWIGAWGLLRDGWRGFAVGAILGGVILPFLWIMVWLMIMFG